MSASSEDVPLAASLAIALLGCGAVVGLVLGLRNCDESTVRSGCESRGVWVCRSISLPDTFGRTESHESCACADGGAP